MRRAFQPFTRLLPLLLLSVSPTARAAGDMLTPDEVKTTGIEANPANEDSFFVGAGVHFGQSRTTEDGATPGLAFFGDVEPGYQFHRGSWGRMEVSGELLSGALSFRTSDWGKTDISVPAGFLAKFGYGYSLGGKAFGLFRVGVGPVLAKLTINPPDANGQQYTSDSLTGFAGMLGWDLVMPISAAFDATAGLSWTQIQLDVTDVSGGGAKHIIGNVIANIPAAQIGLRVRL